MNSMSASALLRLLAHRHAEDVFVPECKDGPTLGSSHLRLDAWAMPRSWSRLAFYGYEVKVSRADWLRDNKLHLYLPLCTDLYLVAAPGVALPAELPTGVGLLEAAKTGTRLFTRVKAAHRDIAPPVELFAYILMCRSRVVGEVAEPSRVERVAAYRAWAEGREDSSALGALVGRQMRGRIGDRVEAAEKKAEVAERRAAGLESCAELLRSVGLDADNPTRWSLNSFLNERGINTASTLRAVQQARASLEDVERRLTQAAEESPPLPPIEEDDKLPALVS